MTRYRHSIMYKIRKPIPVFFIHTRPESPYSTQHVVQQVTHANGNPVRINYRPWDPRARECLCGLQIQIMDFGHEIDIDFYKIRFKCMSPNAPKPIDRGEQIQKCLKRMRDSKCPYGLASQLFTGIKNKKR